VPVEVAPAPEPVAERPAPNSPGEGGPGLPPAEFVHGAGSDG